jgi:hypothetical protein
MNTQREQPNDSKRPQPIDYGVKDNAHYIEGFLFVLGAAFGLILAFDALVFHIQSLPVTIGLFLAMVLSWFLSGLIPDAVRTYKEKHPSKNLLAYREALRLYEVECKAAHEAELRKRSYWEFLDGYAFERATAEVLSEHQFNTVVTPGSGDGGIDIEVTRNGLKGVVQCKAHVACVGPHVVRDLYGVIHHCGAAFGIIVSRGGFTRGAHEFARDKPILFLDTDDLIAMQEGRDVLAAAFSGSSAS